MLVNFQKQNMEEKKKKNKIRVQTKLQTKSTVFSVNLDQASVFKWNKLNLKGMLKNLLQFCEQKLLLSSLS